MRAVTVRRLVLFGVCVLGVGSLYLVPSMARAPERVSEPEAPRDLPTARPTSPTTTPPSYDAPRRSLTTSTATTTATTVDSPPAAPAPETSPAVAQTQQPRGTVSPARRLATPVKPGRTVDETAPSAVAALRLVTATTEELTLRWPAAGDNVAVVEYRVWLDGFLVSTTSATQATLPWFNDDSAQHIVQLRAVDAAGNQSTSATSLLVRRPTESAGPTTTTSPVTPSPGGTPTPSTAASPSPTAAGEPS